jgi:UDPglucose--hexose-1-phosphate uridylyltransferase
MFRRHPLTGDPIVFAPSRAARPNPFGNAPIAADQCPFCAGHEWQTPPEIARVGDAGHWRVRVVPNKYPAVDGQSHFIGEEEPHAGGSQEVIIETPDHDRTFDQLSLAHASEAVAMWLDRRRVLAASAGCRHVALFKNHGAAAGASVPHIHSQVVALPFVPPRIERESVAFARSCPLCRLIEEHRREDLIIDENDAFVWLAPAASVMPFQQWIVPKAHASKVTGNAMELAELLQHAASAFAQCHADYNWMFIEFPDARGHAYIDVFPRLTTLAGFELGSGCNINIIDPRETVRQLRAFGVVRADRWPVERSTCDPIV